MSKQEKALIEQVLRVLCASQGNEGAPAPGDTGAFIRLMEEMPGGFLIYRADRGGEIVYANRGLLRIFQCETMEEFRALTGNSFWGMVYPDDLDAVEQNIWEQISASQYDLDYVEYRIRRKDGAIRWIEDYGHFVHSETEGDIFYVFLGDATDRQNQINQTYLRQLEVIEGLSINYESICYVDLDLDLVVPYRLSQRSAGFFGGQLQPRPYSWYVQGYTGKWVHPEDRETVARGMAPEYIREKLAGSQTFYFNYRAVVGEETQYIQLRVVNVGRQEGVCQAVLGSRRVDEEIQSQMKEQALLAEALAKANLAVDSKNTFLSNMSHDMRTPLHAIFGFTSLAKLNLDKPEEAAAYLDRVESASRQLLDMIDKVLQVSSLSEGSILEEVECDLREIIQEAYDFLLPQAQEKGIAFTLDCGGLANYKVYTDQGKLRQLIVYLVNNAVTYTNSGGRVTVTAAQEDLPNGYMVFRLVVADTGIGISPEFLDRIFEPFTREKNSTLSGVHGIGLGLTIAKNIVDMMGGTIRVQSVVNQGTTFTTTFRFRALPRHGSLQKAAPANQMGLRILLAEDNEINREIEMELLERLGFAIDPVEDGKLALEKIKNAAPGDYDVVLMDLQMPVMDGWQSAAAIRALPDPGLANIPIIALSANMLASDQRRSRECGINVHLSKPMDLPLMLKTIEALTGKPCKQ